MGIWVDTDMGFDDIVALLVLTATTEVDGISLVFGNAPLDRVCANTAGAAAAFGWRFPVHVGRQTSVLGSLETAENVLGAAGMRTVGRSLPTVSRDFPADAFDALCIWLDQPGPHRLLALGPLTNIAALALARPELAARIDELVWMGGGVTVGNYTASAEFNAYADPESLAIVLGAGLPLIMVDLDVCRRVLLTPSDVAPVRQAGGVVAGLLADLLEGYIEIGTSRGRPGHALYDPIAATLLIRPELVTLKSARIEVELSGALTRGRTVVDRRLGAVSNARFAANIDADAARGVVLDALVAAAARR